MSYNVKEGIGQQLGVEVVWEMVYVAQWFTRRLLVGGAIDKSGVPMFMQAVCGSGVVGVHDVQGV